MQSEEVLCALDEGLTFSHEMESQSNYVLIWASSNQDFLFLGKADVTKITA